MSIKQKDRPKAVSVETGESNQQRRPCWGHFSDLKQILSVWIRKVAEIAERSAWGTAMPALDLGWGRRLFRTVEDNPKPVTNFADNAKLGWWVWYLRHLRRFSDRHCLPQK
jgi:hypothetical protein